MIQRITFEDRGQDFLWWEIDDTTGRIVGCGPHQASTWANGRCSVDMATIKIDRKPTFHGPATEPEGRTLNYAIAHIAPAKTGGGVASMTDLSPLIDAVNVKLAGVPDHDISSQAGWAQYRADGERVLQELRDEHGARIRTDREPATMVMGGVKTSATGGWRSLVGNWVHAARRRMVQP